MCVEYDLLCDVQHRKCISDDLDNDLFVSYQMAVYLKSWW